MNHDQHDDDFDDDDDDDILQDGQSVRVPITAMDSVQRAIGGAAHRPGWRMSDDADANDDVADAHAEYCQWLRGAHRAPVVDDEPHRPTSLADAKAEAERAYDERSEWLRNAHKGQQP